MDDADEVGRALVQALDLQQDCPLILRSSPQRIRGGFWAQIWSVGFNNAPPPFDKPLVLRVMPDANAARPEIAVQRWLSDAGFPTPRIVAAGTAPGLGEAYALMTYAAGRSPLGGLQLGVGTLLDIRRTLSTISTVLAETASRLHALDPLPLQAQLATLGVDLADKAERSFRANIDRVSGEAPTSGFADIATWLDNHRPPPSTSVICHGDLHPFNLLIDDHSLVTVLDWTNTAIGPREMDLGLTAALVRCAPISVPGPIRAVVARVTAHLAESFIAVYRQHNTVDQTAVDWWEALQHARCLADLAHGRLNPDSIVGPAHPFEMSGPAMQRRLHHLTGVAITIPARRTGSS